MQCWGNNYDGQLGTGSSGAFSATPVDVQNVSNAVAVSAERWRRTCALLSNGAVRCWGDNAYGGDIGDGIKGDSALPRTVVGIGRAVSLGNRCAVIQGGAVQCWGDGAFGELTLPPIYSIPAKPVL
jgi:hypothetical protein